MNAVLKLLVAAACCIVIAVGGLYLWRQWKAKQDVETAEAAQLRSDTSELFRLSQAMGMPDDADRVSRFCQRADGDKWRLVVTPQERTRILNTCRRLGFL